MSVGETNSGSEASNGERTEQLGRSLIDCAMTSVARARAQSSSDVFMLDRMDGLPSKIQDGPLRSGRRMTASKMGKRDK